MRIERERVLQLSRVRRLWKKVQKNGGEVCNGFVVVRDMDGGYIRVTCVGI